MNRRIEITHDQDDAFSWLKDCEPNEGWNILWVMVPDSTGIEDEIFLAALMFKPSEELKALILKEAKL